MTQEKKDAIKDKVVKLLDGHTLDTKLAALGYAMGDIIKSMQLSPEAQEAKIEETCNEMRNSMRSRPKYAPEYEAYVERCIETTKIYIRAALSENR